jgi:hypothetical protein
VSRLCSVTVWVLADGVAAGSGEDAVSACDDAIRRAVRAAPDRGLATHVTEILRGTPLRVEGEPDAINAMLRELMLWPSEGVALRRCGRCSRDLVVPACPGCGEAPS